MIEADRDKDTGHIRHRDSTVQRTVSVKGSGGVTATMVCHGAPWKSLGVHRSAIHLVSDHGAWEGG